MLNHNKKRNVGLLSEFFAKYIANALVQQRYSDIEKAKNLYVKYFSNNSEISKELKYFNSLYETKLTSKEIAIGLLNKVKALCEAENKNFKKLEDEKTRLLHEISLNLGDKDFFNRPVPDYKLQGAVQVLLNTWKMPTLVENVSVTSSLEELVLENMISDKKTDSGSSKTSSPYLEMTNEEIDTLVVGLMSEKFNSRFSKNLDMEQREIISNYAFYEMPEKKKALEEKLEVLRDSSMCLIDNVLSTKQINEEKVSDALGKKLSEVRERLTGQYRNVANVTDDSLAFYMTLVKLQKELKSND